MAAVTLLGTQTVNTSSGTKTVTATPAVGDLIVLVCAHTGNTSTAAPTDNNSDGAGTYTLVTTAVKASSADTMKVWIRNSFIGSASSTVFTHAPGTTTGGGVGVFKVTGMTRTGLNAIRQSAIQSNRAAATPTPVLGVAALTGNPLIGAVFNATNPATMTARGTPAYTERFDTGYATPTSGLETMSIDSGETGTSIAWGNASASAFCSIIVELDTSAIVNTVAAFERGKVPKRRAIDRQRRDVVDTVGVQPASTASVDRSLAEAFRTVRVRGRRMRTAPWSDGYAPAASAPQGQPVAAWLAPTAIRRRETRRNRLQVDALHWPYIAPEMAAILPVPKKLVRVAYRRKLQEQSPQALYPPATGPPTAQGFPSWAWDQLPPTSQDRRLQVLADAPVYPETPVSNPSVDRALDEGFVTRRIRGRKLRREAELIVVDVATPPTSNADVTAFGDPKAIRRRETQRSLRKIPEHNVWTVTPPVTVVFVASVGTKAKRRKSRQGLFLDAGPVTLSTLSYAPYPSWEAPKSFSSSFERKLQRSDGLNATPATPAVPAQPESAWRAKVANRSEQHRRLIPAAAQITYPATPPVVAQAVTAWVTPKANRIERSRTLLRLLPIDSTIKAQPSEATPRVDAIKRRETERARRSAAHNPVYPGTPAPPQAPTAFKLAEAFRRHGWRKHREVLELDVHPDTPEFETGQSNGLSRRRVRRRYRCPEARVGRDGW